ncbi:hypothetical protein VaNZ11_000201 [Volvox africanus]|uniref:HP domain-containing protein n=1 Tax=Volvox africanus TaxID=51714 RepID=A0ABQ5RM86_9CHLO|nr:hypothetical protein VaNZ11_000201 [Volvox africanus]
MTQQEAKAATGDDGIAKRDTTELGYENGSGIAVRVKTEGDPGKVNVVNTNPTDVADLGDARALTAGHQAPAKPAKADIKEHEPVTVETASSRDVVAALEPADTNVIVTSEEAAKGQHTSTPEKAVGSDEGKLEISDVGDKKGSDDNVLAESATSGNPSDTDAGTSAADPDCQNGTANESVAPEDVKQPQKDISLVNSESTKEPQVVGESRMERKQDSLSKEEHPVLLNQTSQLDAANGQDFVDELRVPEEMKATMMQEQKAEETEVTYAMKANEESKVADENDAGCGLDPLEVTVAEGSTTAANAASSVGSPKGAPLMTPPGTVQALSRRLSSNSLITPPIKATSSEKQLSSGGSGSVSAAPSGGRTTKSPSGIKSGEASPLSTHDTKNTINVSQLLKLGAFKLQPLKDFVSYVELQRLRVEDGIDATRKEDYLNDEEFLEIFGMDRDAFKKQPAWRQAQAKKKANLF